MGAVEPRGARPARPAEHGRGGPDPADARPRPLRIGGRAQRVLLPFAKGADNRRGASALRPDPRHQLDARAGGLARGADRLAREQPHPHPDPPRRNDRRAAWRKPHPGERRLDEQRALRLDGEPAAADRDVHAGRRCDGGGEQQTGHDRPSGLRLRHDEQLQPLGLRPYGRIPRLRHPSRRDISHPGHKFRRREVGGGRQPAGDHGCCDGGLRAPAQPDGERHRVAADPGANRCGGVPGRLGLRRFPLRDLRRRHDVPRDVPHRGRAARSGRHRVRDERAGGIGVERRRRAGGRTGSRLHRRRKRTHRP